MSFSNNIKNYFLGLKAAYIMHILDMNRTFFYFGSTLKCFKWTVADFFKLKYYQ